jgi:uncharacterized membrane protein
VADGRRLDVPRGHARTFSAFLRLNPDAVGRFAEAIARFLGTGSFLAIQTIIVVVWIALNVFAVRLRWDPYPFILLNLAFSTQAAYAAPLILLAQNRQDARDRAQQDEDRRTAALTQTETEYLAREMANIRILVASLPTAEELTTALERMTEAIDRLAPAAPAPVRRDASTG